MGSDHDTVGSDRSAAVAQLLRETAGGDPRAAAAELLPLVYEQLRLLAHKHMQAERPDLTIQATALVHEAYLRLADGGVRTFQGRWHFYAAAAEAMRRILVDQARRRGRLKRGGDQHRVDLDHAGLTVADPPDDLLALDEGLELLARQHPEKAELVKLRYFGGLTMEQAAEALNVSTATAYRHWAYARAWLHRHVTEDRTPQSEEPVHGR